MLTFGRWWGENEGGTLVFIFLLLSCLASPQKLCQSALTVMGRKLQPGCQKTCLETLRILSRDKLILQPFASKEGMLTLAKMARLVGEQDGGDEHKSSGEDALSAVEGKVVVEALKCLCNVVFNSPAAQQACVDMRVAHSLCANLRSVRTWQHDLGLFSLRLLFLLSALRPDLREVLRSEYNAVRLLTDVLEHTLDVHWAGSYETTCPAPQAPPLPAESNERAMEALKALFNLTLSCTGSEVSALWTHTHTHKAFVSSYLYLREAKPSSTVLLPCDRRTTTSSESSLQSCVTC